MDKGEQPPALGTAELLEWLQHTAALGGPGRAEASVNTALHLTAHTATCTGTLGFAGGQLQKHTPGVRFRVKRTMALLGDSKKDNNGTAPSRREGALMADLMVVLHRRFRLRLG